MRRKLLGIILTTAFVIATSASLVAITELSATTLTEMLDEQGIKVEETAISQADPVHLINMAILKGLDISKITYNNKTILDVLDEDQANDFIYSESTVKSYKDNITKARTGISEGWAAEEIINYADEAYYLYANHIEVFDIGSINTAQLTTAITDYIHSTQTGLVDIGDIDGTLCNIMSDYQLVTLTIEKNINEQLVDTAAGQLTMQNTTYNCKTTRWLTNELPFKALFNGMVETKTADSITIVIGEDSAKLKVTYQCDDKLELINENLKVGDIVKQGEALIDGAKTSVYVTVTYNGQTVDLLKALGTTGKLLLNEYKRTNIDNYDASRDLYIRQFLGLSMN